MPDFVDTFFNNYGNTATAAGGYANKVYFGTTKSPAAKGVIRGQKVDITTDIDKTLSITEAKRLYLTDEALRSKWNTTLRKNGITADPIQARAIWDLSVDGASDWYATSNGQQKITPEQYLTWYAGGQKKTVAPKLPSRSIYQYTPEQLAAKADEITRDLGGFTVTDEVKSKQWYKDLTKALNEMVMQGTVTTTQQVKNPKTGKMENVTIQKPEVTTEAITEKIKTAVKQADPESVARKQRIDNTKWLFSQGGQR